MISNFEKKQKYFWPSNFASRNKVHVYFFIKVSGSPIKYSKYGNPEYSVS